MKVLQGRAVAVYWTSEASWFCGRITGFEVDPSGLQITYDDGNVQWQRVRGYPHLLSASTSHFTTHSDCHLPAVQEAELHQVILLLDKGSDTKGQLVADTPGTPLSPPAPPPLPAPTDRVLYPRAYRAAVTDHFEPVRVARADRYVSCVVRHMGSVVVPRVNYTARRYLHHIHLECDVYSSARQSSTDTSESATQT